MMPSDFEKDGQAGRLKPRVLSDKQEIKLGMPAVHFPKILIIELCHAQPDQPVNSRY
jgi:hypothetical protein